MQRTLQHLSSFKQNTETGAACTQHPTKSTQHTGIENITTQLNHWMHQGDPQERRIEAKQRILEAYRTQATVLHLSALNLRELPPQIEQLQSLESLCLWNNNLQTLPAGIGQLSRLVKLNLGRNAFNKLPIEIGQLTQLQELNVRGNPLTELPPEIAHLPHLTTVHAYFPWVRPNIQRTIQAASPTPFELRTNGLDLPTLPEYLANSAECLQFFNAFSQYLNSHYFAIQTLTASSLLEPQLTWTQTLSNALQIFSILGSIMTGEVLNNLAQKRARTEASEQAMLIVKLFPTPLHYFTTVQYAGVQLTQRLAYPANQRPSFRPASPEPHTKHYTRTLSRAYSTLQSKAGLQITHPWEHTPNAKDFAIRFLKTLIDSPEVHAFAQPNNLSLRHYAQNMANIVVRGILGPEPLSCPTRRHSHTLELDNTKAVNGISPDLQTSIQEAVLKALAPMQQQLNALNREINQLKQENKALRQQLSQTAQQPHRLEH